MDNEVCHDGCHGILITKKLPPGSIPDGIFIYGPYRYFYFLYPFK